MIPEIVKNIAVVGAGSFFGGAARYLVSLAVKGLGKGGLTTFSTFSKESMLMLQAGNVWGFAGYVSLSVAAGVVLVALGYWLCR